MTLAYNYQSAAEQVGISKQVIERAVKAGSLPAKRIGRSVRIKAEDLEAWLDRQDDY